MYSVLAILFTVVELAGIVAAVHAVMMSRTSQGAIAWGISLVTFPWLALPLYAVFGRNKFHGYVSLRNIRDDNVRSIIDQCRREAHEKDLIVNDPSETDRALVRLAQLPMTRNNACRLLKDGRQTFDAIFESIAAARNYILVQFYIVRDDDLGRELKSRLIEKARQNVRICFLYDEIGSYQLPASYLQDMQREGIRTSAFHTTRGKTNHFQLNFRNHRKIVIVDGQVAFVGGHNVGDEYVSRNPASGYWRDTHVRVEGPVVKAVQFSFLQDWYWATDTVAELDWRLLSPDNGNQKNLLIASGPADLLETCAFMFTHLINTAKERIWIASPYFVPDSRLLGALKLAALREVDVRILLPEKADSLAVHLASFSFYEPALDLGIRLYRYTRGFMHQKAFIVDSTCAGLGTANLDNRSLRLNFEMTLINYSGQFIQEVEAMLQQDFQSSRRVALNEYKDRSFFFKLAVRFSRLLSPIL